MHHWLCTPPSHLRPEFRDFYALSNYTHAFGLVAHLAFLALFLLLQLPSLVLFNIFSIIIFSITLLLSKTGQLNSALLLGGLEVMAHQGFAVLHLGLEAQFQLYIFVLSVGTLFYNHLPLVQRAVMAILPVFFFWPVQIWVTRTGPWEELEPWVIDGLGAMNLTFFTGILMGMCVYYQMSVEQARAHAEKMSRSKTLFLANMSHELRTPLNAILGFAEMLGREPNLSPKQKRDLDTINRSSAHLLDLINDVLDMSKAEEGKLTLHSARFRPRELFEEVVRMLAQIGARASLRLKLHGAEALPAEVVGDATRLRQVLFNLLNNAVKFTPAGQVTVTVEWRANPTLVQPAAGLLYCAVRDSGVGIARDEVGDLFQLFSQTRSGQASRKGTGLGLAISKRLIELMGGRIGAESTLGVGSTFWFEVPLVPVVATAPAGAPPVFSPRPWPTAHQFPQLIVDDHPENRELLSRLLTGWGFPVVAVASGEAALTEVRQTASAVIWMDLQMPGLDGHQTAHRLVQEARQRQQPKPKIVALTADGGQGREATLASGDFVAWLDKPFAAEAIYRLLADLLALPPLPPLAPDAPAPSPALPTLEQRCIEALRAAPAAPRQILWAALPLGDVTAAEQAIGVLSAHDPSLGEALAHRLERFEWDVLRQWLEAAGR